MFFSLGVFALSLIVVGILIFIASRRQSVSHATAKDNLLYAVMFITLSLSICNSIEIVFAAIDQYFPDILGSQVFYHDAIRFSIASLAILFPLYIASAFLVSKDIYSNILKKDLVIRKIFFYVIAIIMGVTIVTTMIYTIYHWLGGEVTNRFITKAGVIMAIALGLILYALYSLYRDFTKKTKIPLVIALFTTFVVFGLIWGSVLVLGTPAEMRKIKADNQRISQLQMLEHSTLSYAHRYKKLPQTIEEVIQHGNLNFNIINDPITKQPYSYTVLQDIVYTEEQGFDKCRNFLPSSPIVPDKMENQMQNVHCMVPQIAKVQLCAVFESEKNANGLYDNWDHASGKHCFDRAIDIIDAY